MARTAKEPSSTPTHRRTPYATRARQKAATWTVTPIHRSLSTLSPQAAKLSAEALRLQLANYNLLTSGSKGVMAKRLNKFILSKRRGHSSDQRQLTPDCYRNESTDPKETNVVLDQRSVNQHHNGESNHETQLTTHRNSSSHSSSRASMRYQSHKHPNGNSFYVRRKRQRSQDSSRHSSPAYGHSGRKRQRCRNSSRSSSSSYDHHSSKRRCR